MCFIEWPVTSPVDYLNCDGLFAQKFDSSRLNHGLVKSVVPSSKPVEHLASSCTNSSVLGWPVETNLLEFKPVEVCL